jgi:hypothetical protein
VVVVANAGDVDCVRAGGPRRLAVDTARASGFSFVAAL